ncbi:MAG: hypothetical protein U5K69_29695 [Balneolaceae bacterium]|nr:hypothetical protein [Balneolaceae bacterium]
MKAQVNLFGICLGHQLMALSEGNPAKKMYVSATATKLACQDKQTGKVELPLKIIEFAVNEEALDESK